MTDVDALRTRLRRGTPEERSRAVRALAETAGEEAGSAIADAVLDENRTVRLAAIEACADLELDGAIGSLSIVVESDGDDEVRVAGTRALGTIGVTEAVPPLLTALEDDVIADTAREGLSRLGGPSSAAATEQLLDRLEDALAADDRETVDALAAPLRRVTEPAAIRAVRERQEESDAVADAIGQLEHYDRVVSDHALVSEATLTDPDPYVRRDAADEAGRVLLDDRIDGTDRLEPTPRNRFEEVDDLVSRLLELVDDEHAYVRREAALSLIADGNQRAVEPLCRMLDRAASDGDEWTVQVAHWALELLEPGRAVEMLVHELKFARGFEGIVLALLTNRLRSYVGRFAYVDAITRLRARRRARRAVADAGPGEREPDDVAMLALTGTADDVPSLLECLDDPNERVRAQAAFALGHVGISWRRLGVSPLDRRAGGTIDDFGGERDDAVVAALLERLADERAPLVVARLADALGMHGAIPAVVPLIDLLEADDERCRETAAAALGRIGDLDATGALARVLRDDEAERVRTAAATALGAIEDERGVDALAATLVDDDSSRVRSRAAQSLGVVDTPAARRALEDAGRVDPDEDVRSAALGAGVRARLRRSRVGAVAASLGDTLLVGVGLVLVLGARLLAPVSGPLSVAGQLLWRGVTYAIDVAVGWLLILAALIGLGLLVAALSTAASLVF